MRSRRQEDSPRPRRFPGPVSPGTRVARSDERLSRKDEERDRSQKLLDLRSLHYLCGRKGWHYFNDLHPHDTGVEGKTTPRSLRTRLSGDCGLRILGWVRGWGKGPGYEFGEGRHMTSTDSHPRLTPSRFVSPPYRSNRNYLQRREREVKEDEQSPGQSHRSGRWDSPGIRGVNLGLGG